MANNFKAWIDAPVTGQQIQSAAVFAMDTQRTNGFNAGDPASAIRVNSALRQANVVVAALMKMCDDISTLPNGLGLASTINDIAAAIRKAIDVLDTNVLKAAKEYANSLNGATTGNIDKLQIAINTNTNNINSANTKITANTNSINILNGKVATAEKNISDNSTQINTNKSNIATNKAAIDKNAFDIGSVRNSVYDLSDKLSALTVRVTTLEGKVTTLQNNVSPMIDCYRVSISSASWSGSAGNWTFSVAKTTHNRGTRPIVKTFTADNIEIFSDVSLVNGNVTVRSNANIAMALHIYWGN